MLFRKKEKCSLQFCFVRTLLPLFGEASERALKWSKTFFFPCTVSLLLKVQPRLSSPRVWRSPANSRARLCVLWRLQGVIALSAPHTAIGVPPPGPIGAPHYLIPQERGEATQKKKNWLEAGSYQGIQFHIRNNLYSLYSLYVAVGANKQDFCWQLLKGNRKDK